MTISEWWPKLTPDTRTRLIEHNGEPLDPAVEQEIRAVGGDAHLTDSDVDWIEAAANGEPG